MTTEVEASVLVNRPVSVVYNQWTQFEDFPLFMGGVEEVTQIDDRTLRWVAEIAGVKRQWKATILEQVPDAKIAWAAIEGATNAGAVFFEPAGSEQTFVRLHLEHDPKGLVEKAGDALHLVQRRAESDLQRFKEFIESAEYSSGAWRGAVNPGVGIGTPSARAAALSQHDKGKAGLSGKVVAGAIAAAGAAAAKGAFSKFQEVQRQVSARRSAADARAARSLPAEHTHEHWIGRKVVDRDGEEVGDITDIFYDDVTGQPEWLTVSTGWFGTDESFVPIAGTVNQGERLQVDWDIEQIKGAPTRGPESHLDAAEEERLYSHYGFDPAASTYDARFGDRPRADEGYSFYDHRPSGATSATPGSPPDQPGDGAATYGGPQPDSPNRLRPYRDRKRTIPSRPSGIGGPDAT
jgi:uncharacterized protein YndB with AHSA1/START domain